MRWEPPWARSGGVRGPARRMNVAGLGSMSVPRPALDRRLLSPSASQSSPVRRTGAPRLVLHEEMVQSLGGLWGDRDPLWGHGVARGQTLPRAEYLREEPRAEAQP